LWLSRLTLQVEQQPEQAQQALKALEVRVAARIAAAERVGREALSRSLEEVR